MDQRDIDRIQAHLKRTFGNPHLAVTPRPRQKDTAQVELRGEAIGVVHQDEDEDGSFMFEMTLQTNEAGARGAGVDQKAIDQIQASLRQTFGNTHIDLKARPKQKDSAEVEMKGEFIGVIYQDEDEDGSFMFEMAILAEDLDG